MEPTYWSISDTAELLTQCHLRLLSLRNSDDSYGVVDDIDTKFILTANVAQAYHQLGFPLDSPRLANSLGWIKSHALKTRNVHMGRMFRLILYRRFPTLDLEIEEDWEYLNALIEGQAFVRSGVLNHNPIFPLMALDVLLAREGNREAQALSLVGHVSQNLALYARGASNSSYLAYVCNAFGTGMPDESAWNDVQGKALAVVQGTFSGDLWDKSVIGSAYCLFNLSRLPVDLIHTFQLEDKVTLASNKIKEFVRKQDFSSLSPQDIPAEISPFEDGREIYGLSVLIRGMVGTRSLLTRQLDFAHAHLKHVYLNEYDPIVKAHRKLLRKVRFYYPILFGFASVAFLLALTKVEASSLINIVGSIASVAGLALSLLVLMKRKSNDR